MSDTIGEVGPAGLLGAVKISGVSAETPTDLDPVCGPWVTVDEMRACPDSLACSTDDEAEEAAEIASYLLWLLSDKRYPGVCTTTVRPCSRPWDEFDRFSIHSGWGPFGWSTTWGWMRPWGWCCNSAHNELSCGCGSGPGRVLLGKWPVREVLSVEIDGEALDSSEWAVADRRWLMRMADDDGNPQRWPCCQRMDRPFGDEGTWGATITYGTPPPRAGKRAAIAYARQLARGCADDASCELPPRVQSMLRQGVQFQFFDPKTLAQDGFVGLPAVDEWLAAERYGQKHQPAVFINPDDFAPAHRLS